MELCDLSAHELSQLLRKRQASAVEILDSTLKRIQAVDGRPGTLEKTGPLPEDKERVHSFISFTEEQARAQATTVDEQLAQGEDPGLLAGIPFSVKDIFTVRGTYSTAASRILANYNAPYTATPVERMAAAGGVMVGKVNLDEFTFGSSNEFERLSTQSTQSLEPGPGARGVIGGQRRFGGSRGMRLISWHRHSRVYPAASRFLRHRRREAHLRTRLALWADCLCLLAGLPRTISAQCDGRRHDAASHLWAGCPRQYGCGRRNP